MTVRSGGGRHRFAILVILGGLAAPASAACSDSCQDVDCGGGGAYVAWVEGDVPQTAGYRLCIENDCHRVEPTSINDPQHDFAVNAGSARPEDPVAVRFDALAADGAVVASYAGRREATGRCCKAVSLRVADQRLVANNRSGTVPP